MQLFEMSYVMRVRASLVRSLALYLIIALLAGCASTIPRQYREQADRNLTYRVVSVAPESYIGRTVQWGGVIVRSENLKEGTQIEVIEYPLNWYGRPRSGSYDTGGRFLIVHPGYLETAVYSEGQVVTVVGEVVGTSKLPLGEIEYTYPLVRSDYMHLWESAGPDVYYGIGIYAVY